MKLWPTLIVERRYESTFFLHWCGDIKMRHVALHVWRQQAKHESYMAFSYEQIQILRPPAYEIYDIIVTRRGKNPWWDAKHNSYSTTFFSLCSLFQSTETVGGWDSSLSRSKIWRQTCLPRTVRATGHPAQSLRPKLLTSNRYPLLLKLFFAPRIYLCPCSIPRGFFVDVLAQSGLSRDSI